MKLFLTISRVPKAALVMLLVACGNSAGADAARTNLSTGYTAFAISWGTDGQGSNAYHSATIQMVGQGCSIWSDAGPWKPRELIPHTASAFCRLPDGRQLSWKCQTPDGRLFTRVEICDRDYLLANGGLFLISTRSGETQVVQIKTSQYKFVSPEELKPLSAQFPEVAQFLAGKPLTPKAPADDRPRDAAPAKQ